MRGNETVAAKRPPRTTRAPTSTFRWMPLTPCCALGPRAPLTCAASAVSLSCNRIDAGRGCPKNTEHRLRRTGWDFSPRCIDSIALGSTMPGQLTRWRRATVGGCTFEANHRSLTPQRSNTSKATDTPRLIAGRSYRPLIRCDRVTGFYVDYYHVPVCLSRTPHT